MDEQVEADARGRIALGQRYAGRRYQVQVSPNGEMRLLPMVSMTAREWTALQQAVGVTADAQHR